VLSRAKSTMLNGAKRYRGKGVGCRGKDGVMTHIGGVLQHDDLSSQLNLQRVSMGLAVPSRGFLSAT